MSTRQPPPPEGVFSAATRVSQLLAVVLVAGYLANWTLPQLEEYLALVPAQVATRPWTLVTSSLFETNLFQLLFCVVGLLFTAKVLEPIWGSKEFVRFVAVVSLCAGFCTFAVVMAVYLITAHQSTLYLKLSGFHGVVGGLLVGIKQALPDREARIFSIIRIPGKYLPSLYVLAGLLVGSFLGELFEIGLFAAMGTYWAWWYLRFFQPRPDGRGDGLPDFRFASFFPGVLHRPIDAFATACSRITRIFPDTRGGASMTAAAAAAAATAAASKTPAAPADASRRRERGARVLEERLGLGMGLGPKPRAAGGVVVLQQTKADLPPLAPVGDGEAAVAHVPVDVESPPANGTSSSH